MDRERANNKNSTSAATVWTLTDSTCCMDEKMPEFFGHEDADYVQRKRKSVGIAVTFWLQTHEINNWQNK